jgi:hypothetical protein
VNRFALAVALALAAGGVQAAAVELVPDGGNAPPIGLVHRVPDLAVAPGVQMMLPAGLMPELPEPEVFAMMLVGLVLIGYRARRDSSSEKFK